MTTEAGCALFDTAIGRCAIAWTDRGIAALQLPECDDTATPFSSEDVAQLARHLASQPYAAGQHELPRPLRGLSYDQYRMIRLDRARAL